MEMPAAGGDGAAPATGTPGLDLWVALACEVDGDERMVRRYAD